MTYIKLLNQVKDETNQKVNEDTLQKIIAFSESIKKLNKISWSVKTSISHINKLYKVDIEDFTIECRRHGLDVIYPLNFAPDRLISIQNKLDALGNEILEVANELSKELSS